MALPILGVNIKIPRKGPKNRIARFGPAKSSFLFLFLVHRKKVVVKNKYSINSQDDDDDGDSEKYFCLLRCVNFWRRVDVTFSARSFIV
jgi:hypothetical protein